MDQMNKNRVIILTPPGLHTARVTIRFEGDAAERLGADHLFLPEVTMCKSKLMGLCLLAAERGVPVEQHYPPDGRVGQRKENDNE